VAMKDRMFIQSSNGLVFRLGHDNVVSMSSREVPNCLTFELNEIPTIQFRPDGSFDVLSSLRDAAECLFWAAMHLKASMDDRTELDQSIWIFVGQHHLMLFESERPYWSGIETDQLDQVFGLVESFWKLKNIK